MLSTESQWRQVQVGAALHYIKSQAKSCPRPAREATVKIERVKTSPIVDLRGGALVHILPQYRLRSVCPSRQFSDAKIKRFVETLKKHVGEYLGAYVEEL